MQIRAEAFEGMKCGLKLMRDKRKPYWPIWRELAQTYLPYTHPWLLDKRKQEKVELNPYYITSVGLTALRVQTAGLMNGITSPTRPWFALGVGSDNSLLRHSSRAWIDTARQIMLNILARSNFYNVMAMMYFDLGLMNSSGMQVFEDPKEVVRFQRFSTGEYYVEYDFTGKVRRFGREFELPLADCEQQFGKQNLPKMWQEQLKNPIQRTGTKTIKHVCERKDPGLPLGHPADRMAWREVYWTDGMDNPDRDVLAVSGYWEQPATFPRWSAELELGNSPAMDALADMRELQQIILKKGVGLEKMIDPPMLLDASLRNKPKSMMPGGHSYIQNLRDAVGARPVYQLQVPFQEIRLDIQDLKTSIREILHNDLFKMISQLDTVRSATEIDAKREEKLVLIAHFLERFENEQLDPTIERVFNICMRNGIFPPPPEELRDVDLSPTYISILATAQRAIGTAPLERLLQVVSNISAVEPSVLDIVNFDEFVYTYGTDIGAKPTVLRDEAQLKARRAAREQQLAQVEATATADTAVKGAKTLSQTDVGGGANALQMLLG